MSFVAGIKQTILKKPSLLPLALVVAGGLGMYTFHAFHYLSATPDVAIDKRDQEKWNSLPQSYNAKAFSFNPEFWANRESTIDPQRAFLEDESGEKFNKKTMAKIQAIKRRTADQQARASAAELRAQSSLSAD